MASGLALRMAVSWERKSVSPWAKDSVATIFPPISVYLRVNTSDRPCE